MKNLVKTAVITTILFSLASCADWFQENVSMDTTTTAGTLADFFVSDAEISQLESPSQVAASQGEYS